MLQLYQPLNFLGTIYREIRQSLVDISYVFEIGDVINWNYAYFTKRTSNNKNQIVLGESDVYEANCRMCFYK